MYVIMFNQVNDNINVLFWNAHSIAPKHKQTEFFNVLLEENVQIAVVTETWLKNEINFYISEYKIYRQDRNDPHCKNGGGVAILIKNSIQHFPLPSLKTKCFETVGIKISCNNEDITIIGAYFRGGNSNKLLENHFKHDLSIFNKISGKFLIVGDFNCRNRNWNCMKNNTWGRILDNKLLNSRFTLLHTATPTYYPHRLKGAPSTIDLVLTNYCTHLSSPITLEKLNSDHLPILLKINKSPIANPPIFSFIYSKANWSRFKNYLSKVINISDLSDLVDNPTKVIIDKHIDRLTEILNKASENSIPKKLNKCNYKPFKVPEEIKELISRRNSVRRLWIRNRNLLYKARFLHLNSIIKERLTLTYNKNFECNISSMKKCSKSFWNLTNVLKNKKHGIPTLKDSNNSYYCSNFEKAQILGKQFCEKHNLTQSFSDSITENLVSNSVNQIKNCASFSTKNITVKEIKIYIRQCKNRKSAGSDKIKNILLKNLDKKGLIYLCKIFNACLKLGYFPDKWKIASVVPIAKPGKDKCNINSYRPISLLSSLSKLFEKCIKSKILHILEDQNILPNEQFGFRPDYCTSHQVARINKIIKHNFTNKKSTGMITLDVEAAFDSVWHDGLIYKLNILSFPIYIIKIIYSFLSSRKFLVNVLNSNSDLFDIRAGTPQGSVLSPLLYIIYTSDFPSLRDCNYALYADDTAILSSAKCPNEIISNLEKAFRDVSKYYYKWKIKINTQKTQAVFFTKNRKTILLPSRQLFLNGTSIPWESSVKYLGFYLDSKLLYKMHTEKITAKCNILIKTLYPLINRNSKLSTDNKMIIFRTIFQSIMLYGCEVWGTCAFSHIKKIQIKQNQILKMVNNLPFYFSTVQLHQNTNSKFIFDRIKLASSTFELKTKDFINPLVRNLYL